MQHFKNNQCFKSIVTQVQVPTCLNKTICCAYEGSFSWQTLSLLYSESRDNACWHYQKDNKVLWLLWTRHGVIELLSGSKMIFRIIQVLKFMMNYYGCVINLTIFKQMLFTNELHNSVSVNIWRVEINLLKFFWLT